MSKKYNLKFNPPELSSEQIQQHADFDALMNQFEATEKPQGKVLSMRRRIGRYAGGLSIAASVALLLFFGNKLINPTNTQGAGDLASPFVNPPLEMLQPSSLNLKVDGTAGGVLEYESGTKVTIPANAFVTKSGELVSGDVEIRFKEYHDHIDFFLAGIPMGYDSAGTKYQLESAGMLEVYAYQNGEEVLLNPEKPLNIELVSTIDYKMGDQYNIYKLDEEERNWVYKGTDDIEPILDADIEEGLSGLLTGEADYNEILGQQQQLEQQIAGLDDKVESELAAFEKTMPLPTQPVEPQQVTEGAFATSFDFSDSDLDDPYIKTMMSKYDNMIWEVSRDQAAQYSVLESNPNWADFELNKVPNDFRYELILKDGARSLTLYLTPVLQGNDYATAKATFEADMKAFEAAKAERDRRMAEKEAALRQMVADEKTALELRKMDFDKQVTEFKKKGLNRLLGETITKRTVINRFKVTSLGIWNCDRPYPMPASITEVKASFKGNNGKWLDNYNGFFVNKSRNSISTFVATRNMKLQFDNTQDNLMWIVTQTGQIAVCQPEDFDKVAKGGKSYTFEMDLTDEAIESEAQLREILAF